MKKFLVLMLALFLTPAFAGIEDSVEYESSDGNYHVYSTQEDFIFIDASEDWGSFISISIPTMQKNGRAGYAIIPAMNLQQMSDNFLLAKEFISDCEEGGAIFIHNGIALPINEVDDLHAVAIGTSCKLLDEYK
ncbi:hypothetical protein [Moraxella sp. VT-16-12]|uniref:hypothetical protein n=1 Tax=Moraxella sp. VT-16-12 TaxID=2014877 RepID=UPI000B7D5068|nr:hypothetical protein [Moraxella sp. VT-16-12]TWV82056.1 hypothetical protein CEW93_007185 [Moraxella sp. VT-16-12]